jgi:uncharacterized protein
MEYQIQYLALLAIIDGRLDELNEEYGDLPLKVKELEKKTESFKELVDETRGILDDIKKFVSVSKVTLVELKTKEEKLAKQQFKVRNNKEFDAITKEIEHLRAEHLGLTDKLRTEALKEENLNRILESQVKEFEESKIELTASQEQLSILASDQNEEVNLLLAKRKRLTKKVNKDSIDEYERIRKYHVDPVVKINKNSCSGCFNSVPPQKIVEIRNQLDKLFFCENCGRILFTEEFTIDESMIEKL